MALAGVTGGELVVKDTVPEDLRMIRLVFERLGLRSELHGADVIVPGRQQLEIQNDAGGYTPKIQDGPWPAFPADLTSVALALATQAEGSVIDPRVDVREPAGLHRQAAADGRRDHDLRPAPGDRRRAAQAARRARGVARYPRRDGDADRRPLCGGHDRDRQHRARSTAATSGSTSGCARSARGSSASRTRLRVG